MDCLLLPSVAFSLLLASLYGAVFHFIWGKSWRELGLYWAAAVLGFAIGQAAFTLLGLSVYMIGEVRVAEGTIVSWACMFVAKWLKV